MAGHSSHGSVHKHHGPKKHMFHCWTQTERLLLGNITYTVPNKNQPDKNNIVTHQKRANLLSKYSNKESWLRSCASRGIIRIPNVERLWMEYVNLPTNTDKNAWLKKLPERNLYKEEEEARKTKKIHEDFRRPERKKVTE